MSDLPHSHVRIMSEERPATAMLEALYEVRASLDLIWTRLGSIEDRIGVVEVLVARVQEDITREESHDEPDGDELVMEEETDDVGDGEEVDIIVVDPPEEEPEVHTVVMDDDEHPFRR